MQISKTSNSKFPQQNIFWVTLNTAQNNSEGYTNVFWLEQGRKLPFYKYGLIQQLGGRVTKSAISLQELAFIV